MKIKQFNLILIFLLAFAFLPLISADTNITSCGYSINSGGYYQLNQSLNMSGGGSYCIYINADNVYLNGNDFTITGDNTITVADGIYSGSGKNNVTIENLKITNFGFSGKACLNSRLANGIIRNITIWNCYIGLQQSRANMTIDNINISGTESFGLYLSGSSVANNTISNVEVSSTDNGLNIWVSGTGNTLANITSYNASVVDMYINGTNGINGISGNFLSNNGIRFETSTSGTLYLLGNTTFAGTAIYGIDVGESNLIFNGNGYSLIGSGSGNGIQAINMNNITVNNVSLIGFDNGLFLTNSGITANTLTVDNFIYNNSYGIIEWIKDDISLDGNFVNNIILSDNRAYVNSASLPALNFSANITLRNIGNRGFRTPAIFRDGAVCSDCTPYTSLIATNVIFGVTGFSEYKIGDNSEVISSGCNVISGFQTFTNLIPILIVGFFAIIVIGMLAGISEANKGNYSGKNIDPKVIGTGIVGILIAGLSIIVGIVVVSSLSGC